jgi:hypothetical protein
MEKLILLYFYGEEKDFAPFAVIFVAVKGELLLRLERSLSIVRTSAQNTLETSKTGSRKCLIFFFFSRFLFL